MARKRSKKHNGKAWARKHYPHQRPGYPHQAKRWRLDHKKDDAGTN